MLTSGVVPAGCHGFQVSCDLSVVTTAAQLL